MITFIKQNKLLTLIAALFVAGIVYYAFFMNSAAPAALTQTDASAAPGSQDLLVTLANLKTIRLDDAVFSDPVFTSLTDFGVVISPESVGRRNPFSPISPAAPLGGTQVPIPGR